MQLPPHFQWNKTFRRTFQGLCKNPSSSWLFPPPVSNSDPGKVYSQGCGTCTEFRAMPDRMLQWRRKRGGESLPFSSCLMRVRNGCGMEGRTRMTSTCQHLLLMDHTIQSNPMQASNVLFTFLPCMCSAISVCCGGGDVNKLWDLKGKQTPLPCTLFSLFFCLLLTRRSLIFFLKI